MQFHTFETAKQRVIREFQNTTESDQIKKSLGLAGAAFADMRARVQATARTKTNEEILTAAITSASRPPARAGDQHSHKVSGNLDRIILSHLSEYEWLQLERPFYNVYPIVEKLVRNTKLQVSAAFLQLPYRTMLFRFAAGHEPYGIKTILLTIGQPHEVPENTNYFNARGFDIMRGIAATATVQYADKIADGSRHDVYTLAAVFEEVKDATARPYEPRFPLSYTEQEAFEEISQKYQTLQSLRGSRLKKTEYVFSRGFGSAPAPQKLRPIDEALTCCLKPIDVTIHDQHNIHLFGADKDNPAYMGFQSLEIHQFIFKLATLVSMLHRGDNLIAPIVLAKHQDRYDREPDEAAKKWLEDKAAHIQGRGFSVGKELQKRSDVSPHYRNPHMALYWTGPGRKEPTLIFRAGADVMLKKIARVPTGFLGPEKDDEPTETTRQEYVYFLREPHTGFVKIGRTSRTIAARKRQLECGIHGLILVGHIVTGDCVELETRLHREYAEKRRRRADGRQSEFFELTDAAVQEIVCRHGGTFHLEPETVCNDTTLKSTSSTVA